MFSFCPTWKTKTLYGCLVEFSPVIIDRAHLALCCSRCHFPFCPISFCLLFQLYVITFFHAVDLCDNAKTCIVTVGLNYHHHDNHDNTM